MDFVARTLRWQRFALGALLVVSALGFWRGTYDVFNTTKATVILTGTIAMLLIGGVRASRTRRLHLPRTPALWAAAAFGAALVIATFTSATPLLSVVGRPGRHTGLVMYGVYLLLFVLVTRLYRDHSPAALVKTLLAAAVPISLYGLLQASGTDPLPWQLVEGGPPVFSTFGNANFFAGWLGAVVPLYAWGALTRTWSAPWRIASAVGGVAALWATYASNSQQGPLVAVAGSLFVIGVWIASADRFSAQARTGLLAGGGAVVLAGLGLLVAGVGPLAGLRFSIGESLGTRTPKWRTALGIWRDNPITGVGLERFADYYHEYRPEATAAALGLRRTTDTPHNIPLDMLANGGLLLFLAYLAFVGLTAWALVVGLRRNRGEDRLLLAGIGGAWLAYQVQSLVSIDVPPIAVLHYVLAGMIVAVGTRPPLREFLLPGAKPIPAAATSARGKKAKTRPARVPLVPVNPLVTGAMTLLTLGSLLVASTPFRADRHAARALRLEGAGGDQAVEAYRRAAQVGFWEARYPALEGAFLSKAGGRTEEALDAHLRAAAREPRALAHNMNVARLSASVGNVAQADEYWDRVLTIDPKTPDVLVEVGRHKLSRGDHAKAAELIQKAVALRGDVAAYWVALGEVREAQGNPDQARQAFQQALAIDPQVAGATEGIARLDAV